MHFGTRTIQVRSTGIRQAVAMVRPLTMPVVPLTMLNQGRQQFRRIVPKIAARPTIEVQSTLVSDFSKSSTQDIESLRKAHAQLIALMPTTRVLAYSSRLAKALGSAKAALFISQLVYWTRVGDEVVEMDGWIHKSREEWTYETGLSRCEQETVRRTLVTAKVMQEHRGGRPARLYFKVNLHQLATLMAQSIRGLGQAASAAAQPGGHDKQSAAAQLMWQSRLRNGDRSALLALLGSTQPFHYNTAEILGDIHASIVLSRLIWLQGKAFAYQKRQFDQPARNSVTAMLDAANVQGEISEYSWFAYSARSLVEQLGLSRSQVTSGIKRLINKGWLLQKTITKPARQSMYQLCPAKITQELLSAAGQRQPATGLLGLFTKNDKEFASEGGYAQNLPTRVRESQSLDGRKSAIQSAGFEQHESRKPATYRLRLRNLSNTTTNTNVFSSGGGHVKTVMPHYSNEDDETVTPRHSNEGDETVTPRHSNSSDGAVNPLYSKSDDETVNPLYSKSDDGTVNPLNSKTDDETVNPLNSKTEGGTVMPHYSKSSDDGVTPRHSKTDDGVNPLHSKTDDGGELVYPAVKPLELEAIKTLVTRFIGSTNVVVPQVERFELVQSVLDELAGSMKVTMNNTRGVASPVGFIRRLLSIAATGEFVPERAYAVRAAREARHAQETQSNAATDSEEATGKAALETASIETQNEFRAAMARLSKLSR